MNRPPLWYNIPSGTRATECKAKECRAVIYFVETATGSKVPVNCDIDGAFEPTADESGRGISHFSNCAAANSFSKKAAK